MKLNVMDEGSGQPVIIMHGLFGSISNWKGISKQLLEHARIIRVDLRNHGHSPWDEDTSYPAMADDVVELMDDLDLAQATLVGHSMGGKVAMTLALREPHRAAAMAVVDIAPVAYEHSHEELVEILQSVDLSTISRRADLDAQLSSRIEQPTLRAFLGQNLAYEDGAYTWRINLPALARGMNQLTGFPDVGASRFEGACVFVYGEASGYVAARHRRAVTERFPHARLVGVAGAGHWVHAEKPGSVIDAVHELLEALPGPA